MPASRLLKERSISSSSGDVDHDVLAELLVSGLEAFEDGCELLSDDVSDKLLLVPLVLVLSVLELPDGELGKDTEDLASGGLRYRLRTGRLRVTG